MTQANAGPGIKAPPLTTQQECMRALLAQIATDALLIVRAAQLAEIEMAAGSQNMAIGGMMSVERELERMNGLWQSVRALHNP